VVALLLGPLFSRHARARAKHGMQSAGLTVQGVSNHAWQRWAGALSPPLAVGVSRPPRSFRSDRRRQSTLMVTTTYLPPSAATHDTFRGKAQRRIENERSDGYCACVRLKMLAQLLQPDSIKCDHESAIKFVTQCHGVIAVTVSSRFLAVKLALLTLAGHLKFLTIVVVRILQNGLVRMNRPCAALYQSLPCCAVVCMAPLKHNAQIWF
jgi:hypothetical protein